MSISLAQFVEKKSRFQVFLDRYQYILSIAATFLFFSDVADYLYNTAILPLSPLSWIWIFVVLALPFVKKLATIPKPLLIWMFLYASISLFSLATISGDEESMQEFRTRILSIIFICLMYVLYEQKSLKQIKYAVLAVVVISVANNFYDLLNPKIFTDLNVGRPAGFYINPNKAGCALVLGAIFSIDIIKKPYRWLYLLTILFGILATFSRGALLGWIICALFMAIGKILSDKRRTIIISTISLVLLLTLFNPFKTVTDYFEGGNDVGKLDILERIAQFQNPSAVEDDSALERKAVAGQAWIMFGKHPFWGSGLASTKKWTVSEVSTHNMYLSNMADHGIIGIIFLPGLVFAVVWHNRGEPKAKILSFVFFISLWGIFSHNVLEERYILLSFALFAAINTNQKWYLKYSHDNFQAARAPDRARLILPPARQQTPLKLRSAQRILPPSSK